MSTYPQYPVNQPFGSGPRIYFWFLISIAVILTTLILIRILMGRRNRNLISPQLSTTNINSPIINNPIYTNNTYYIPQSVAQNSQSYYQTPNPTSPTFEMPSYPPPSANVSHHHYHHHSPPVYQPPPPPSSAQTQTRTDYTTTDPVPCYSPSPIDNSTPTYTHA